jgi:NhaA family Na+:H+ antiporter
MQGRKQVARSILDRVPHWSQTPAQRIVGPLQEFIHNSAAGGIVLISAAVLALILANSPLSEGYNAVLHSEVSISAGPFALRADVLHWVNDGLMAVFFFLVGLEMKRELLVGELSNRRAAMLPLVAAVGGAAVPAVIYVAMNSSREVVGGWGVPMATDIAFALGILALLGSRVPFALKVFLISVAIIDDLIAVLVIAIFYSSGINFVALGIGIAVLVAMLALNLLGVHRTWVFAMLSFFVWLPFFESGVHSTIAGVLAAWMVPARFKMEPVDFVRRVREMLDRFETIPLSTPDDLMITDQRQQSAVIEIEDACEAVQAPLQNMEHSLHFPVNFVVMPLFALANAGVALSLSGLEGEAGLVTLGIILGLVVGKPVGIMLASWLAVRTGLGALPEETDWMQMLGAACLGGVGFTMSLFIAALAFGDGPLLDASKLGILAASLVSGTLGYVLLRRASANQTISTPEPTAR